MTPDKPKTELAVAEGHYNARGMSIREMSFVANEMMQARMFPDITSAHTAFVKIMAGAEMNIGPFQAMAGIHIIQGKAVVGGGLLAGLVKASPKYDYDVLEQTDKACRLQFREGKKVLGVSEFTIEDARKAGTKNLEKFPKNMLFNRAMSNGVKWYCPDATSGPVYVDGEIVEHDPALDAEEQRVADDYERGEYVSTMTPERAEELKTAAKATRISRETPDPMPYIDDMPGAEATDLDAAIDAVEAAFTPNPITEPQIRKIYATFNAKGIKGPDQKRVLIGLAKTHLGLEITSGKELSKEDAMSLIDHLEKQDPQALQLFFGGDGEYS